MITDLNAKSLKYSWDAVSVTISAKEDTELFCEAVNNYSGL